ncbi:MAG: cysteine desulfurase [Thermoleophilia bacterium]|nr:cysteine desulfurase [Thermoleophilia bacterium]
MRDPIYLDYNATTPVAPEVVEAMVPALREAWGNPSSTHAYGRRARSALDVGRGQVAGLLGCEPTEIIFTSGGTESDNAAIVGVAEALSERGQHIVTSVVEHAAIEQACRYLERRGWSVSRVPVDGEGRVDPEGVADAVRPNTVLISIMHAQNETGVIQPIREIADRVRGDGIVLHSDAAQSVGKLAARVDDLGVDLLTIAGHKLYGPKGVGALYLRTGTPFVELLKGAGHEAGRRSGTENVPAIVGLGAACELAERELPRRSEHMSEMRDRLEQALRREIPDLVVHGASVERLPNTLSVALPGADATQLVAAVDGVAAGSGAACHSGKPHVSPVLRAMNVAEELALCTLRLTTGRSTTPEEIDAAASRISQTAFTLREKRRQAPFRQ